jgi:hypothetical protein
LVATRGIASRSPAILVSFVSIRTLTVRGVVVHVAAVDTAIVRTACRSCIDPAVATTISVVGRGCLSVAEALACPTEVRVVSDGLTICHDAVYCRTTRSFGRVVVCTDQIGTGATSTLRCVVSVCVDPIGVPAYINVAVVASATPTLPSRTAPCTLTVGRTL